MGIAKSHPTRLDLKPADMIKLSKRSKLKPEIPVAAMSDVAFLLTIFFIVSSSFHGLNRLPVELPGEAPPGETPRGNDKPPPRVRVTNDRVLLNDQRVELWQLTNDLETLLRGKTKLEERVVTIAADDKVPMERIVEAMDAIRLANATVGQLDLEGTR